MTTRTVDDGHRIREGAVVVAGVVATAAGWAVGRIALGHDPQAGGEPVGLVQVAVVAVLTGLVAWATTVVLGRRRVTRRAWWLLAGTVAALSLSGPLTQADGGSAVALVALHLVLGAVLAAGLGPGRTASAAPARPGTPPR